MSKRQGRAGSIYDLFASLGLDTSELDSNLAASQIKMDAFTNHVSDSVRMLEQLGSAMGPKALSSIMDQLQARGSLFQQEIQQLHQVAQNVGRMGAPADSDPRKLVTTDTDIVNQLTATAELQRVAAQRKSLEAESLAETKRITANRKAAQREEIASDREYANLKKQLAAEVAAAEKAKQVEESRAFQVEMNAAATRRQRRRAAAQDEATEARARIKQQRELEIESLGGGMSKGGIGAEIRSSFYLGGIAQMLGVEVPMGLTSVLGRLESVQRAMHLAFPALVVGAFASILYGVSQQIKTIADEHAGLGVRAREAWDEASQGARKAAVDLANYIAQMGKIETRTKEMDKGEKIAELGLRQEDIKELIKARMAAREEVNKLLAELGTTANPLEPLNFDARVSEMMSFATGGTYWEKFADGAMTYGQAVEKLRKNHKDLTSDIYSMTAAIASLERQKDKDRAKDEKADRDRRRRDPVHEMPWRLPWFLGQSPADFFLRSLEGAPARRNNFFPSPPTMRRTPALEGPSGRNPLEDKTASVVIENNFNSPLVQMDGMPANMEQAVGEKIMPVVLRRLKDNQATSMDQLIAALKAAGVRVV